jgi:NAD(P)-dependent dehydrogenase (short-subunit alcohol dehydrogenase family)
MSATEERCILITGSSSGLGRASAELFAARGWRVVATMRAPERETALRETAGIELVELDTTHPDRIAEVAAAFGNQVDVVFNNAGYGMTGPLEGLSEDQILRIVNTNLLGTIRMTKAFLPYMRHRRGLFINTTSIGGLIAVPFNSMYHATKWGVEGFSEAMAMELSRLGVGVKIVEPGGMKTDFFTRSLDTGTHPVYESLLARISTAFSNPEAMANYSTPEQIAEVVYGAATDGSTKLRYLAGDDAKAMYALRLEEGDEEFRIGRTNQLLGEE